MIGWIVCAAVSVGVLVFQIRLTWRAVDNTSRALRAAHEWREMAELRSFPGMPPDVIMLTHDGGVPHRENDCGPCIKYVRQ
jgi:hypothetical protein